ncbi:MAG: DNA polymerase I [Chloroflexi bacterium GWB2_49_20]|nr:MAG: DNA polymerase I [Chloroflexi bacterium GWB2_49_20]OGN79253.1 MAG: DNA polymerase I [Chloroflexi bacterium GWC2_49_37]OGN82977.1 MAG: DNA polymerase I [Chloroflexi bacterium GWD2_49_16]HCC78633.1 DNA polymerase I [Anaerolineae bacterium]
MTPTLYLIDGHALAYRTYYALSATPSGQRWQTSSGEPTAGIFGFTSVLFRILEQEKPDFLAVAFDTGKTFRDTLYPEYKATRAKMPDDLRPQIERIRQLVDAFNIPRLEMEGYEADDVLGSAARQAAAQGLGVKIITGDRDLLQLVDKLIIVSLPEGKLSDSKDFITDEDVENKMGVPPRQVVDYKALLGDKSDNIPGVPGIGEKTARILIQKYQDLDNVYAHLEEIEPRWRTKLEAGKKSAYLSQDLARIRVDLPVHIDLDQARPDRYDPARVEALFHELEFRSLLVRFRKLGEANGPLMQASQQLNLFGEAVPMVVRTPPRENLDLEVQVIDSGQKLLALSKTLADAKMIAVDTETTSVDPTLAELVGISLSVHPGQGFYIPVGHQFGDQLNLDQVVSALRASLENEHIEKVGHNIKYDYIVLARHGLRIHPLSFDSMIAEWVINPASRTLGLKNLAEVRLDQAMTHIEGLIGKGKNQISMSQVPIADAAAYAAMDAEVSLRLRGPLEEDLKKIPRVFKLFSDLEMPLIGVLAEMEMVGIGLDREFFSKFSEELRRKMETIERQIITSVGKTFNLNSTQQLSTILFETLRLTPPDRGRKTASGHYSTSADVLEGMRGQHQVVDWILEYRELTKLKSTYVDALPVQINPQTGHVHTSFSQTGAVTGRLSSSNPNLQNIPIRTEMGRRVRRGFIAAPGNVLLAVDYSQIELRIVAFMAQDQAMMEAFRAGQDIHATTAAAIYGIPLGQVSKEQRRHAKAINFGLVYGMSSFGLTRTTDLTLAESEDFVMAYFQRFPGVKSYLDGIRREVAKTGFVETLLGRRRYFPGLLTHMNANLKNREEREAINAPIQGTAADIMKLAMLNIQPALQKAGLNGKMILQVHDELVLECPRSELGQTARLVQQVMENAYPMSIPLTTEARWGRNWDELKPISDQT